MQYGSKESLTEKGDAMEKTYQLLCQSPIGPLTLTATADALTSLDFGDTRAFGDTPTPLLKQSAQELEEYFAGVRKTFTIPLAPTGTAFQKKVWSALLEIPYGRTATYGEIAAKIGKPGGAVAVGQANSRNPIPILIPCHRVIGADGKMVGYTGGMHIKEALLGIEGVSCKK